MSTHNKGFYEDLTKIIFQLSSNMHQLSSSGLKNMLILHEGLNGVLLKSVISKKMANFSN